MDHDLEDTTLIGEEGKKRSREEIDDLSGKDERRRRNRIDKLQNGSGGETEDLQEMEGIARAYFQNLFTTRDTFFNDHLFSGINRCISKEDNRQLIALYTGEEI
ncbi:hypothetical protein J1N35_015638 [Gossypium stocksii]|uniref:Uncharacterized protein n=1 Tax=Gossypium stocksii TaxID=47602 RepID=A0A9D3VWS4_9ROSI|nr:hypothetical protein J1N35_015638 [Gossypium stocksii]